MILTSEEIKRHKEHFEATGEPRCPRDYLDTIESQATQIEQLKQYIEALEKQVDVEGQQAQIEQLQAKLEKCRNALEKAKERFGQYARVYGSIGSVSIAEEISEALQAIEKIE